MRNRLLSRSHLSHFTRLTNNMEMNSSTNFWLSWDLTLIKSSVTSLHEWQEKYKPDEKEKKAETERILNLMTASMDFLVNAMIRYLYIFDLQRPYPSTLDKKRLKSIVGNKCHPVDIYIEEERLSARGIDWSESPNNSDNAQSNYKNIYLSTVRIWSSRTRTHDTDLLPKCFTCQTQHT